MKSLSLIATALAALAVATPGLSQSLQVTVTAGGAATNVSAGGTVALTAIDIGQPVLATVTVRNAGAAAASITGVSISGTPEMALSLPSGFPVLAPNASTSFAVQYLPSTGNAAAAQVSIGFANGQSGTFPFTVTGTSPRLAFSYSFAPNGGLGDLNSGDRINFPGTNIGTSLAAVVTVLNRGSATATLQSTTVTGLGFQFSGAPGLLQLPAGMQTSFAVIFNPLSAGASQGLLVLALPGGNVSFSLSGVGTATAFTVTYTLADGNVRPLTDGAGIGFPTIDVNATSTATIEILNQGTGSGIVSGIALSGAGFRLSGVPLLPATVGAGQSLRFGIVFAPTQTGTFSAAFRIELGGRTVSGAATGSTTTATFLVSYALADGVVSRLSDGVTINFPPVDINGTTTAIVEVANQGTGAGAVSAIAVAGAGFRVTGAPPLPLNVSAGQVLRFGIVFAPTQAGTYNGTFRIDLPGRSVSGSLTASTAPSNISLAYIEPDTNNFLPLRDGAALPFPNTASGTSSTVTLVVNNSGAGTGTIDSVAVNPAASSAFQLLNLPVFPASVPPSQQLRFGVRFSPQQQQAFSGALIVSVNGRAMTVNLQAQGSGPQFTYAYGASAAPATPGGTVALGETTVGQTNSVTVSVTNAGNAGGQIANIGVTGAGFSLSDLPSVPFTVRVGGSQNFTVNFAPSQPGAVNGRLTIGNDAFTLSATGIGARLTYSYTNTTPAVPVAEGGVVIFPPLEVGKNQKLLFAMQNTGTSAATISSINLAAAGTAFALEQLPALPFNLDAGSTATFGVSFAPGTTGSLSATLRVNNSTFTLSGNGTQPAALSSYEFQAPGNLQPAQQPAIGLTLATAYPLPIDGTLRLTFVSSVFTDDPAIQFAAGGRTVNFTIPANSTRALFNGNPSMALQTGTTAGTIVVTPSFAMRGGFDMTPRTADALSITIPRTAPQLLNAGISSQTGTSFTLVLSGYSTTRAMRQLDVQFTPKQGESFGTARLTIDVTSAAAAWYQSAASQNSGGSFLAAIPFVLQNGSSTADLVHRLQSLSITVTNDIGVSTAVTVPIP